MAITPDTNLKLLKCNLNLDNSNQLNFSTATAQYTYFNSLTKIESSNFSYQRKDNVIRYPAHIDSIIEYNYVMYQNHNYTDKWFYAYIVRMEYVNDGMTNIYIKTDPYQTWQFNLTFMRSFVEREHVNNDTIGLHTVPENLETGEYINNGDIIDIPELRDLFIVVGISDYQSYAQGNVIGSIQNGIFSGLQYVAFNTNNSGIAALNTYIKSYDTAGKASAIYTIFMAPTYLCPSWEASTESAVIKDNAVVNSKTITLSKATTLDSYTPKNNKVKCYPYNYLLATNNNGSNAIYKYELFNTSNVTFDLVSCITTGCSIRIKPIGYNSHNETQNTPNNIEGLDLGKYPTCSWISDSYTNWLTQNSVNIGLQVTGSVLATGVGVATANPVAIASGVLGVANTLGSIYQNSLVPDQAIGNINNGDVQTACGDNTFAFRHMSVKQEYAKIIDNFFTMYGYKVNDTKVPNITGRRNWNYVKTIDCNIEGYIPQEDLEEIKGMFNTGVTIWHNPSTFLDYSQNNDII